MHQSSVFSVAQQLQQVEVRPRAPGVVRQHQRVREARSQSIRNVQEQAGLAPGHVLRGQHALTRTSGIPNAYKKLG
jgi:hypothetical protein